MTFESFSDELFSPRARRSGGLILVEQIGSTQELGRRIAEDYQQEGAAIPDADIVAWRQATGRGRQGRCWSSPPGHGIYATLLRSLGDNTALQLLPLRVGTALCQTLNRHLGGSCRLKWPNDLQVGSHKLGGILIQALTPAASASIGFGINYSADLAAFDEPRATSFCHEGGDGDIPSLAALTHELIADLDEELGQDPSLPEVIERYENLSSLRVGEPVRCRIHDELVEGELLGFDDHGFLRLRSGDGEERILTTGEIWDHAV